MMTFTELTSGPSDHLVPFTNQLRLAVAAYDRARKNLDRHPNYILAAYMASGT